MVNKNTNAFRERFQRWKNGELVYDKGRPVEVEEYGDGKDAGTATPPVLPVKHGDKVDTDQCAAWSNSWLRDNGYLTYGNAWNLKNVDTLYNGYSGIEKPTSYDKDSIERYNHAAADSLYKNFDSSTLDKSRPYAVNMFYNGSPAQEEAYLKGSGVTGTHTGVLTFNPSANRWYVTHNIHGTIHQEPFGPLQSGKGKYGVTAVYEPRKNTVVNKVKGLFGFEDGKDNNISDSLYISIMERVAEENNPIWNLLRRKDGDVQLSVDEELRRILNDNSYDYRGYYNKYPNSAANADTHWTDEFKTVYNPTFSVYSKYSGKKSLYNPEGVLGGQWINDQYVPAWGLKLPFQKLKLYRFKNGKDDSINDSLYISLKTRLELPEFQDGTEPNSFDEWREEHPVVSTVASFIPVVGTAMDVYDAYKDPSSKNIGYAALSAATDVFGGRLITKAVGQSIKRAKLVKKLTKEAKKELRGWDYFKDMNNTKEAERIMQYLAKRMAERKAESLGYEYAGFVDDASRMVIPAAVYAPDALANITQHGFKNGKDSIYIKPSKRGTFTAAAKRRGMTVSQLESAVLNNPSNYSEAMRKKAQFSRNARKWKH